MRNYNDKYIEEAFAKIRAEFEKRENTAGLEILDSFEEGWAEYGSLTDRQLAWLEKQLDGSWRTQTERTIRRRDGKTPVRTPQQHIVRVPPMVDRLEQVVHGHVLADLEERGKKAVDPRKLDKLEAAIEELRQAVRALK